MTGEPGERVMVAMSGGVDSSVAAALLVEQGYDVIGATLKLWQGEGPDAPASGCCAAEDAADARRVAAQLEIPHYVFDYTEQFASGVVEPFVDAYVAGQTPNPCIECNRLVKFSALLDRALALGCDRLATGHHARISFSGGRYRLHKAADEKKDQSYVLAMLGQEELASLAFPVGEMTKSEVRARAHDLGLRTAAKEDSQDVCFVGAGGVADFVARRAPGGAPGFEVVGHDGSAVGGELRGAVTIGQRRGIGVAGGERLYVTAIEPDRRRVRVGPWGDLLATEISVADCSWVGGRPPPAGERVGVKIRYGAPEIEGFVEATGDRSFTARLSEPAWAVTPGQALVCYREDEVLGGGRIAP